MDLKLIASETSQFYWKTKAGQSTINLTPARILPNYVRKLVSHWYKSNKQNETNDAMPFSSVIDHAIKLKYVILYCILYISLQITWSVTIPEGNDTLSVLQF